MRVQDSSPSSFATGAPPFFFFDDALEDLELEEPDDFELDDFLLLWGAFISRIGWGGGGRGRLGVAPKPDALMT
jgi:hypothetical protein